MLENDNSREVDGRFEQFFKYKEKLNLQLINFEAWETVSNTESEIQINGKEKNLNHEELAEYHFEQKGYEVYNTSIQKKLESHHEFVQRFVEDNISEDLEYLPSGFPDFIVQTNDDVFLVEVKSQQCQFSFYQIDFFRSYDFDIYIGIVNSDVVEKEYVGFKCHACDEFVGENYEKVQSHKDNCSGDFCEKCYAIISDGFSHQCINEKV